MQMLYDSDHFAVMQIEFDGPAAPGTGEPAPPPARQGGYEIVDKLQRKEIYLAGDLAASFRQRVDALVRTSPSVEEIDEFLSGFTPLMQQPLVLH